MNKRQRQDERQGSTLRILSLGQVDYLDPQRSFQMLGTEIFRCLVRSLMTYPGKPGAEGSVVVPDLALDYPKVSSDGCTYEFRLRPDIYFGPPCNRRILSGDFKYALERLLKPATRGRAHIYIKDILGADEVISGNREDLVGVSCPDETHLRIQLRRSLNDSVNAFALPSTSPVPREIAELHPADYDKFLVSSGPYIVREYDPISVLRLARNPGWDSRTDPNRAAWVDEILVRFNVAWEEILVAIEDERADLPAIVNPDPTTLRSYSENPRFAERWHANPTNCARYITLNTRVSPFDDVRIRQAFNFAVDKFALREIRGGSAAGEIATTILPPSLHGYRPHNLYPSPNHRGDIARAKALLAESGYPDGFETWALVVDVGYGPAIGRSLKTSLSAADIRLDIHTAPVNRYFSEVGKPQSKTPIAASVGWCADWPGSGAARSFIRPLFHGSSINSEETTNFALYSNPRVDSLIDHAEEAEPSEALRMWGEIDEAIMRDAPCVPWLNDYHFDLISSRLRNYFAHPFLVGADWANLWLAADEDYPLSTEAVTQGKR